MIASKWTQIMVLLAVLAAAILFASSRADAAPRFDVYFIAIGSTHYVASRDPNVQNLHSIDGANHSAELVASRLQRGGARYGLVLTSEYGAFVSLTDIQAGLRRVEARMAREHPASPLMIVYFAGHGLAEGVGWNHFSIPGDFAYVGDAAKLPTDALAEHTLNAASLADALDKLHAAYLVVLDTCSEGDPAKFDSTVLTPQASQGLAGVADALRILNEFRQESPVIFSAAPGTTALVVRDPTDPDPRADAIAPLARRIVLLADSADKAARTMTLGELVRGLAANDLDPVTQPGVTHAAPGPSWQGVLIQPGAAAGPVEHATGGAPVADVCCVNASSTEAPSVPMTGWVRISGDPGEFISAGRSLEFRTPGHKIALTEVAGDISLRIGEDSEAWTLSFAGPKGSKLEPGAYPHAERDGFQDDMRPGLSISSASRACNTVGGNFAVAALHREANGRIDQLEASFRQRCDDNPGWLTATVQLSIGR